MGKGVSKINRSTIAIPALDKEARYSSRLSARSALFTDLSLLLMNQTAVLNSAEYRDLVIKENLLSRTSLSSRKKIWQELKKRYILDATHPLYAVFWKEWKRCVTDPERAQTVYCFLSLNDRLVADLNQQLLFPLLRKAPVNIRVQDVLAFLERSAKIHPEISNWTDTTKLRLSRHYLASIRDFGLAKGKIKKITTRPSLYGAPARLLIRALRLNGVGDNDIIRSPIFRLLAVDQSEVIDALSELNRKGDILFKIQGDVIEMNIER